MEIMIDLKQVEDVAYFNYLDSMITNNATCTLTFKSRISMAKTAFSIRRLFRPQTGFNLRKNY